MRRAKSLAAGVDGRLEPGPGQRARRLAVHDQQVQQQLPTLAALLGLELVEERGRPEAGREERHHRLELRVAVGLVHVLAEPAVVERLVALLDDGLHEAGLDLLLGGELRGQVEHLHRAAEVARVELLGGGAHELAEAPGDLDRVLGQGDDVLHRHDLVRGAEVGRVGHDLLRHRPVRELLPEVAEDLLGARLDAHGAQAAQVLFQLLLALRLGGGDGDRLRGDPPSGRLGRRSLADALLAQALLEERESPQAGRRGGRRELGRRGLRRAPHHLDRAGADHLRLAEVGQRASEAVAVGAGGAGLRERRAHGAQEGQELLALDEVELADHAELVQRVEEQVHEGQLGLHRLLPLRPALELGRGALDRGLEEHGHRVGDHQGRDAVGEVLVDLLESGAQLDGRVGKGREGGGEGARRRLVGGGVGGPRGRGGHLAARPRRPQGLEHLAGVRVAVVGLLREGPRHHRREAGREIGRHGGEGLRVAVGDRVEHRRDGGAGERALPGEDLVEHRAEREDVRARGGALALRLLGRHVVRRAHDDAGRRPVLRAPREAEVHDLDLAVRQHVHVAGLEVAVHDALRVGEGEPVEDLLHDRELVLEAFDLALGEQLPQVAALEQLHGHEGHALLLAEVVDGDDVRVVQLGRGLGLALEADARALVGAELAGDDLDRHLAAEHGVEGPEHLSHGALAELADDLELADLAELHPMPANRTTQEVWPTGRPAGPGAADLF